MSLEGLLQKAEETVAQEEVEVKRAVQETRIKEAKTKLERLIDIKKNLSDISEDLKKLEKGPLQKQIDAKRKELEQAYKDRRDILNRFFKVGNFEKFLAHEEVASQDAVEEYNRLLNEKETLSLNEVIIFEKLRNKYGYGGTLEEGVPLAHVWVETQLQEIEKEIYEVSLDIPEEREKIIEQEVERLEKKIPSAVFISPNKIEFMTKHGSIGSTIEIISDEKISFKKWWDNDLYPADMNKLIQMYGEDTALEILRTVYSQKIHTEIEKQEKNESIDTKKEDVYLIALEKGFLAKQMRNELQKEVKKIVGYDSGTPQGWKLELENRIQEKERAQREIITLDEFEKQFKGTEYRLDRGGVVDVTIEKKIKEKAEELEDETPDENNEPKGLINKKNEINKILKAGVIGRDWFGIKKAALEEKEKEKAILEEKIRTKQEEINTLALKRYYKIIPNSYFDNTLQKLSLNETGDIQTVLMPVREFLKQKTHMIVPTELIKKIEEYDALRKELE